MNDDIHRELRAARERIVEGLRTPGRPPEQLLEVVVCRRADGRETSLAELPLARQLSNAETVRAEEVELSLPDGRSVRTLVNATPIRGEDGAGCCTDCNDWAHRVAIDFVARAQQNPATERESSHTLSADSTCRAAS